MAEILEIGGFGELGSYDGAKVIVNGRVWATVPEPSRRAESHGMTAPDWTDEDEQAWIAAVRETVRREYGAEAGVGMEAGGLHYLGPEAHPVMIQIDPGRDNARTVYAGDWHAIVEPEDDAPVEGDDGEPVEGDAHERAVAEHHRIMCEMLEADGIAVYPVAHYSLIQSELAAGSINPGADSRHVTDDMMRNYSQAAWDRVEVRAAI